MRNQIELAISLSPALLLVLWTFAIAVVVNLGVPLRAAWQPFWVVIFIATVAGVFLAVRHRPAALFFKDGVGDQFGDRSPSV
jgi:hypothetical protein